VQEVCDELLAIANTEDRGAGSEQFRIDSGAAGVIYARWTAGDNDTFASCQRGRRRFAGRDFGIDTEFTDLAGDEMTVLSSGVEDRDLGGQILS
jgi:hypothetical protein